MPATLLRRVKAKGEVPDFYWCNKTGSDANTGSYDNPWQHRWYAKDQLAVGETVQRKSTHNPEVLSERVE